MTTDQLLTFTRDQLIQYVAASYGPHDLDADSVLLNFVDADARNASWDDRCQAFGRIVADTAQRRQRATAFVDSRYPR